MELLVVILIIGILTAIAVPAFLNQRKEAALSTLKSDLKNAATAMETVSVKSKGKYPVELPPDVKTSDGNQLAVLGGAGFDDEVTEPTGVLAATFSGNYHSNGDPAYDLDAEGNTVYTYGSSNHGGPFWDFALPSGRSVDKGTKVTAKVDIKGNKYWCQSFVLEQFVEEKEDSIPLYAPMKCGLEDQWTTVETEFTVDQNKIHTLTSSYFFGVDAGDQFTYRNASIALAEWVDEEPEEITSDTFCIEGKAEIAEQEFWHYSKADGGVEEGRC